ncbi:SLATT domain-containing protein [Trebonia kvetii]|uniref:SLATT domain-containing protein n=1 Tax=Trebonia kvetii TaxID=2480626 RepID=UPI0016528DB3|nr:SLATT domain-containing protein [Trebonia kvetii]
MTSHPLYEVTDEDLRVLILAWYRRVRLANQAHAEAGSHARRNSMLLGIPAVTLSAVVGSAIFATIDKTPNRYLQIAVGLLSLTTAVLAAFQTFLRLDEQVREHEVASRSFGAIRRELGQLGAIAHHNREETESRLEKVRERYDQASAASRNVPQKIWDRLVLQP